MKMKVIQVGNGNAARMHRQCFPEGIEVIAIIDKSPQKREQAENESFPAFPDINSVASEILAKIELWDICTPDEHHLPAMETVLEMGAKRVLVEKPICVPSQIEEMEKLLSRFPERQIVVEETYASSKVVEIAREQSERCGILRPRIIMEQSKNRMKDIMSGRFIDPELGVFALETPHSITAITATGEKRLPSVIREALLEDMKLPDGEILPRQGKGKISYLTEDSCQVELYSAMNGEIFLPLPELDAPTDIPFGNETRYRVLILEEGECRIIGQFEPIPGWPRFRGRVLVYEGAELKKSLEMEDKPMNEHIAKAIRYFNGQGENPAPAREALSLVKFLKEVIEKLGS